MARRALTPVLATCLVSCSVAAATANGTTGASKAYLARVTKLCNSYTPRLDRLNSLMLQAEKRSETYAYDLAQAQTLVLGLDQDTKLRAIAVPAALAARIDPILGRLREIDGHVVSAIDDGKREDAKGYVSELQAIGTIAVPLNGEFDRAGLKACGTDQK